MENRQNKPNHLNGQTSPYLLQHLHNPVDWYPWGDEAFEKAERENKPIFLSSGYSTCHWCHVMNRETFQDPEIAAFMNEHFVNIKIDREERPDVDRLYMTFLMATTGEGGWPMNVWLTPDRRPFAGGLYYPPRDKPGRTGFKTVLERMAEAWATDRDNIHSHADDIMSALRKYSEHLGPAPGKVDIEKLKEAAFNQYGRQYDAEHGGYGLKEKFPGHSTSRLIARLYDRFEEGSDDSEAARTMFLHTLRRMAEGGLRDHLGGGFHRYTVDREWQVPHFEKMLYDQAQHVITYLEAYQMTGDQLFADVARQTLDYVKRRLTHDDGGFYSAEDAESLREEDGIKAEGAFYVWDKSEIKDVLGEEQFSVFIHRYGIEPDGNIPETADEGGDLKGRNIPVVSHSLEETADESDMSPDEVERLIKDAERLLLDRREQRPAPGLDDKVITSWNGLMISAFARAYQVLGDPSHLETATRAAGFLKEHLFLPDDGTLARTWRGETGPTDGFADDYAFLIGGLLDLYEAGFNPSWLKWAVELQEKQDELFLDSDDGGYFNTHEDDPHVLLRFKEDFDDSKPSANSVSAMNLFRMAYMRADDTARERGRETVQAFGSHMESVPTALPHLLAAALFDLDKPSQIVIAGDPEADDTMDILDVVHERFLPGKVLLMADGGEGQEFLSMYNEALPFMNPIDGKASAYICEDFVCEMPVNTPEEVRLILDGRSLPQFEQE